MVVYKLQTEKRMCGCGTLISENLPVSAVPHEFMPPMHSKNDGTRTYSPTNDKLNSLDDQ
jgi:hypothetical protein